MSVEDVANRHSTRDGRSGGQCLQIGTETLPLHFDGWKCFFDIRMPTQEELKSLPVFEITSPLPYKPQSSLSTRRLKGKVEVGVEEWRKRLLPHL